jgi:hypothetical protein
MMTQMHKGMDYSPIDVNYWKENGRIWLRGHDYPNEYVKNVCAGKALSISYKNNNIVI